MHLHRRNAYNMYNPVNTDTEHLHVSNVYQCSCAMAEGCLPLPDSSTVGM